jgi:hypothetical protein
MLLEFKCPIRVERVIIAIWVFLELRPLGFSFLLVEVGINRSQWTTWNVESGGKTGYLDLCCFSLSFSRERREEADHSGTARFKARTVAGSWVRMPPGTRIFFRVFQSLCCPVHVQTLRKSDLLSKESQQMSKILIVSEINFESGQARCHNPNNKKKKNYE